MKKVSYIFILSLFIFSSQLIKAAGYFIEDDMVYQDEDERENRSCCNRFFISPFSNGSTFIKRSVNRVQEDINNGRQALNNLAEAPNLIDDLEHKVQNLVTRFELSTNYQASRIENIIGRSIFNRDNLIGVFNNAAINSIKVIGVLSSAYMLNKYLNHYLYLKRYETIYKYKLMALTNSSKDESIDNTIDSSGDKGNLEVDYKKILKHKILKSKIKNNKKFKSDKKGFFSRLKDSFFNIFN